MKWKIVLLIGFVGMGAFEVKGNEKEKKDARSFHMGMGAIPYGFQANEIQETYRFIRKEGEIAAFFLEEGVPWPEAYKKKKYSNHVENELKSQLRLARRSRGTYLAVTPFSHNGSSLAGYWEREGGSNRPEEWSKRTFSDEEVVVAYTNYCQDLIRRFRPRYFNYAIHASRAIKHATPEKRKQVMDFFQSVYSNLKKSHPQLLIFLSLSVEDEGVAFSGKKEIYKQLLQFSDCLALSCYPYFLSGEGLHSSADPGKLPRNWLERFVQLAPEKPFIISQTACLAEDLVIDSEGVSIKASEEWQKEYMVYVLNEAQRLNARLVVWYVPWDYDAAWEQAKRFGFSQWLKIHKDCGLVNGEGKPRPALSEWKKWRKKQRSKTKEDAGKKLVF